jgi:hemerythrin-like domain-containing protein
MTPSKVFQQMREDHRRVLARIAVLETAAGAVPRDPARDWPRPEVVDVLAMLAQQFRTHMAAEEEVLYPALAEALPGTRPSLEPLEADHASLRMMLSDLEESLREPSSRSRNEGIAVQLRDLADLLRIHIRKEEVVVFAVAERALSRTEMEALAARVEHDAAAAGRSTQRPGTGHSKGASS